MTDRADPGSGNFERLFREHYVSLFRFAMRLVGDRTRAEELVQSVFAKWWMNRDRLTVEHSEKAYLFAAVRNAALNERKQFAVRRAWAESETTRLTHEPAHAEGADAALERNETEERVRLAIAQLPERCRMVMELRWREQMSYAEIAEVMGISVKGVENQLARGIERMRSLMS